MIKCILILMVVILAILGLAELFHGIRLFYISPKKKAKKISVIFLNNDCAEQQLNYAVEQFYWLGSSYADHILAINTDLSEDNKISCRYIAEKNGITFCGKEQLNMEIERNINTEN